LDGSLAFTTSFGDAVKIYRKRDRSFVFSTNNLGEVCGPIKSLIDSSGKRKLV